VRTWNQPPLAVGGPPMADNTEIRTSPGDVPEESTSVRAPKRPWTMPRVILPTHEVDSTEKIEFHEIALDSHDPDSVTGGPS